MAVALRFELIRSFSLEMFTALEGYVERAADSTDSNSHGQVVEQALQFVAIAHAVLWTIQEANLRQSEGIDTMVSNCFHIAKLTSSKIGESAHQALLDALEDQRTTAANYPTSGAGRRGRLHEAAKNARLTGSLSIFGADVAEFSRDLTCGVIESLSVVKVGPVAGYGPSVPALLAALGFGRKVICSADAIAGLPLVSPVAIRKIAKAELDCELLLQAGTSAINLATKICEGDKCSMADLARCADRRSGDKSYE